MRIRFIYFYAVSLEFSRMDIGERDRQAQMILVFDKRCGSKNRGLIVKMNLQYHNKHLPSISMLILQYLK